MTRQRMTREERKQETRRHLQDAGARIFAQFGFYGASVDKIAAEAGYTKGGFYAHFDSKESLFLTLFEQQLHAEVASMKEHAQQPMTLEAFVSFLVHGFESDLEESRTWDMLKMEFILYAMREESVRAPFADMILRMVGSLTDDVKPLLAQHDDAVLTPEALIWAIVSLESGMAIYRYILGDSLPVSVFEQSVCALTKPYAQ
ncbi:TetR/AcrR family transcriptional regulator [Paenibacillus aurantiacus]|uniref:TetR/AcrR family transcriptional regulator n=1 Tax=Paenibacillus aurantiacus TaxID=1936118 RepID=A0ABV5KMA2_9BACL